jgi:Cu(I)/Ag(I) efflux system periplasmic protein CusF
MKHFKTLVAALLLSFTSLTTATAQVAPELAQGEVRKVDLDAGKLTLKHGPIKHLDMPPMTMVFRVKDAKLMDGLKAGDKVEFAVRAEGNNYVVTQITVKN